MTEIRVGADVDHRPFDEHDGGLLAPPSPEELRGESPLDALRDRLASPVEDKTVTLRVPSRPGITLRFRANIDEDKERKPWMKRATKKSRRQGQADEVDEMHFACLVLANTHLATMVDGKEATDVEGTALQFRHKQLWDMVGAVDPQDCIRKLFANDPHVLVASGEVLLAAGFDDDLTDPTEG